MEAVANIYSNIDNRTTAERSTTKEMMMTRQAQEVQAAMVIAKRFPRNEVESFNRIIRACQRRTLAEQAMYEYPRGGTRVTGPSIRLAEAIAQNWGNMDFGIIELERRNGESQAMAYAWDLETNTRNAKTFSVPHVRETKKGNMALTDPRDIYELVANQGARRLRSCILGIIPGDVVDSAVAQCNNTLAGAEKGPIIDTVRQIVKTFEDEYGVTSALLEKFIGCKVESFTMNNLIRLKKVYLSLKDGMAKREDFFEMMPEVDNSEIRDPFEGEKGRKEKKAAEGKKAEARKEEPKKTDGKERKAADPSFVPPEDQLETPFR